MKIVDLLVEAEKKHSQVVHQGNLKIHDVFTFDGLVTLAIFKNKANWDFAKEDDPADEKLFKSMLKKSHTYVAITPGYINKFFIYFVKTANIIDINGKDISEFWKNDDWKSLISEYLVDFKTAFSVPAKRVGYIPFIENPTEEDWIKFIDSFDCDEYFINDHHLIPLETLPEKVAINFFNKYQFFKQRIPVYGVSFILDNKREIKITVADAKVYLTRREKMLTTEDIIELATRSNDFLTVILTEFPKHAKIILAQPDEWKGQKIKDILNNKAYTDTLAVLEDSVSERVKLAIIDENPDHLKHFHKQSPRMKQQAVWATDRINRKTRGF